jgi:hypothetical protein
MGAISATLLALCKSGDHIVASNAVYGGSYALMHDFLPERAGITATFVDITDLDAVRKAITDKTRAVYTESMSNPTLRVADIPKLSSIAREAGIPLVVDNTFSPLILSPVDHGADIRSRRGHRGAQYYEVHQRNVGRDRGRRVRYQGIYRVVDGPARRLAHAPRPGRSPRISACASRICRSAWPRTANARWRLHNASTTLVRTSVTRDSTVIRIAACSTN